MTTLQRKLPWTVLLLATLYVLMLARPQKVQGPYDFHLFGSIPVSDAGRIKPLDTVARNSLMVVSDRQSFRLDGKRHPAIRWLADVIVHP